MVDRAGLRSTPNGAGGRLGRPLPCPSFSRDQSLFILVSRIVVHAVFGEEIRQRGVFASVGLIVRAGLIAIEGSHAQRLMVGEVLTMEVPSRLRGWPSSSMSEHCLTRLCG